MRVGGRKERGEELVWEEERKEGEGGGIGLEWKCGRKDGRKLNIL